jgi:flagellar FliL protein
MAKKKSGDDDEKKGGKKKLKPIIGGVVALALVYNFVLKPKPSTDPVSGVDAARVETTINRYEGEILAIPELVVNVPSTTGSKSNHYLRLGMALILAKGVGAATLETQTAIASDAAIEVLSTKTYEEMLEPTAKAALRDELTEEIIHRFGEKKVTGLLLTSFVMQ